MSGSEEVQEPLVELLGDGIPAYGPHLLIELNLPGLILLPLLLLVPLLLLLLLWPLWWWLSHFRSPLGLID